MIMTVFEIYYYLLIKLNITIVTVMLADLNIKRYHIWNQVVLNGFFFLQINE